MVTKRQPAKASARKASARKRTPRVVKVSQVAALAETIAALQLGPQHRALIAHCEGLAQAVDAHPDRATLWREYRAALESLDRLGEGTVPDGQAAFLGVVSTPVGDPSAA